MFFCKFNIFQVPDSIPERGIASYDQLKNRFRRVEFASRQAALVPESTGMWGHVLAITLSFFLVTEHSFTTEDDDQSLISRAGYFVDKNKFLEASECLEKLTKLPKNVCQDWIDEVKRTSLVRQTISVAKAESQLHSIHSF